MFRAKMLSISVFKKVKKYDVCFIWKRDANNQIEPLLSCKLQVINRRKYYFRLDY